MALTVEVVPAAETLELRGRVLRDGRPHEGFAEDDWPETFHLAVRDGGRVVGVASFIPRDDGWQLRGMAVDGALQGRGIGRELMTRLLDIAAPLVKPGGRLVYAVCSLLSREGAGQTTAFLSRHSSWMVEETGIDAGRLDGGGRLLTPGHDSTDGFFVASLMRK